MSFFIHLFSLTQTKSILLTELFMMRVQNFARFFFSRKLLHTLNIYVLGSQNLGKEISAFCDLGGDRL